MTQKKGNSSASSGRSGDALSREERLKAALKANMARRKAQGRARAGSQASEAGPGADRPKDVE
jgi:hypothetical protein